MKKFAKICSNSSKKLLQVRSFPFLSYKNSLSETQAISCHQHNNSTKRKKERNLFLPKALLQARHVQVASEFNSWEPEANIKDQSLLQEYTNGLYAKRLAKDKDLVALTPKSKKTKINENLNSAGDKRNVSESVDKTKDKCENCNQLFGKGFVDRHNKSGKCKLYSKYIEYGSKIAKCRLCTQSNTQMKNIFWKAHSYNILIFHEILSINHLIL